MAEGGKGRRPMKPVPPRFDLEMRGGVDGFPLAAGAYLFSWGRRHGAPVDLICLRSATTALPVATRRRSRSPSSCCGDERLATTRQLRC